MTISAMTAKTTPLLATITVVNQQNLTSKMKALLPPPP